MRRCDFNDRLRITGGWAGRLMPTSMPRSTYQLGQLLAAMSKGSTRGKGGRMPGRVARTPHLHLRVSAAAITLVLPRLPPRRSPRPEQPRESRSAPVPPARVCTEYLAGPGLQSGHDWLEAFRALRRRESSETEAEPAVCERSRCPPRGKARPRTGRIGPCHASHFVRRRPQREVDRAAGNQVERLRTIPAAKTRPSSSPCDRSR